ncbi:lanC-like protein 3 homolog [Sabethes cyaneus]|uniref:lanC-like protein 3 homolog n=1 Tax=Sabethes cyaneus TaxID=53552 RepID=UPI00237EDD74|nr:lanC-like protein 3 homolog [Sabethes cyaneus]
MSRFFDNPYDEYNESIHGTETTTIVNKDLVVQLVKDFTATILTETKKSNYKLRDDLYVGEAGIAFMFWKLSRSREFKHLFPCLEHASSYIQRAYEISESKPSEDSSSIAAFLCGKSGINAVSAVISHDLGNHDESRRLIADFLKGHVICNDNCKADEMLVGRAGYLSGAYWLNQSLPTKPIKNEVIQDVCQTIIKRGRGYSRARRYPLPLMYAYHESDYLGAAHGLCAILHMLLESPWFMKIGCEFNNISVTKLNDIKASVEHFLLIQDADGNFPTKYYNSNKKLIHWCHGCAGVIYLLAKAYLIFNEDKYLEAARKCADLIWGQGLLRKGPGICHGVAGNGYAFLLMFRLTRENKYLYRAAKFMEFLTTDTFKNGARKPDRPYSLYEGLAGTVCFLVDLLQPSVAHFPFMDVFDVKYNEI